MPYCYYANVGWCDDWTPLILIVFAPPWWFGLGCVLFWIASILDKRARPGWIVRWTPFFLMLISAVYFLASEALRNCVISASANGDGEKLNMCLNLGGDADSLRSRGGPTAIWIAISKRNVQVMDILISRGAALNQEPPCSMYAPIEALNQNHTQAVDEEIRHKLIKAGARECAPGRRFK